MKRGMRAQGGESQEGGIANGGALKERFRRIVSRLLSPPLLFPASGNARVRLSVWKGEGGGREGRGGEDYFARNASSSVGLTECPLSNTGRVLLDSKGKEG